jgi:predicted transcriptional regulator
MRHRSRTDIIAQILEAARGDRLTKAQMMYKVLMSYAQLEWYLALLVQHELLDHDKAGQTYRTTEKGALFLRAYEHLHETLESTR